MQTEATGRNAEMRDAELERLNELRKTGALWGR